MDGRTARIAAIGGLSLLAAAWWLFQASERSSWPPGAVPRGNLLLVTVDTLRADRLDAALTPNLARLAARGRQFRTTYAHAPLTLPSHASILTGLLPPAHGARGNGAFRLDASKLTLAERLRTAGYRTGAFIGAFVLDSRFGLDQGFDHYDGVADERAFAADFGFAQRRAPEVLGAATKWILDPVAPIRPWFAWVHLFDPHAPYDAPGAEAGYDGEVRFVDRALGNFLAHLDRGGALARTLIIVTADHGEALGEHGESTHGLFAYDSTMRVPLVVSGPGLGPGIHDDVAALVDLVPTVLDVLSLPEETALPGRSLRLMSGGSAGSRATYLEAMDGWLTAGAAPVSAIVRDGWKLIDTPLPELYDLGSDPAEAHNVIAASAERAQQLRAALPALAAGAVAPATVSLTPEAEARLRSLGYASGAPRPRTGPFSPDDDPKRVLPLYERFLGILAGGARDLDGLREVLAARPTFEAARLATAAVLIETGQAAEAIALLEAPAAAADASAAIRERLGAAYLAAGQPERAAAILKRVVSAGSASADAWNALGVAQAQLGRRAQSRQAFDEAAKLAPAAARIRFNRALARLESGDRSGAAAEISELTRQFPAFGDGWKLLATLSHESGQAVDAVTAWQRVLALDPRDLDVLFNLAVTLRQLGRTDEARDAARRFLETAPQPAYNRERAIVAPLAAPRQ
jgi:arylsulfatase A-like enzyme/Flp pilus assembly protein TadD